MSALSIQPTYPIFTDIDGQPLEAGFVWIGQANLDPQVNPINVFWDAALTIPAVQPIRTLGGYPSNNGTPARLYVNSDYSIRVMNKNGSVVYSAPEATERYNDVVTSGINAQNVVYDPPFVGAAQSDVEAKLSATVSPTDFGGDPTGVEDSTDAVQAAFDYVIAQGNVGLNVSGTFLINNTVSINKSSGDRTPTYIFGGGTFKKMNAGLMFDTSNNATSEIFFNNIHFVANPAVNVVAFACNQEFIRGFFYNCSFGYFDVCFDSTGYLMQSFRINGCDFYDIKSWVIDCGTSGGYSPGTAFDVTVSQSQIEGQSGGLFRGAAGIVVRDCVIENITGKPVLQIINGGAVTVADNYFEDCQQGIVVFDANANVSGTVISGNVVNLHTGTKFVVWGKTLDGCVTLGNTVNGGQTNDTSQTTSGYVASLYDDNVGNVADGSAVRPVALLRQGSTFTPTVQGSTTAGTCTYTVQSGKYQRIGNVITFQLNVGWSGHTGTGNIEIKGLPFTAINEFFALSALPNGITLPTGRVLSAAILGAADVVFLTATPTDGSGGTYTQLAITSHTSGNVIVTGTYLAA